MNHGADERRKEWRGRAEDVDAVARDVDSLCICDDLGLCGCGAASARDLLREQYAEIKRLQEQNAETPR